MVIYDLVVRSFSNFKNHTKVLTLPSLGLLRAAAARPRGRWAQDKALYK